MSYHARKVRLLLVGVMDHQARGTRQSDCALARMTWHEGEGKFMNADQQHLSLHSCKERSQSHEAGYRVVDMNEVQYGSEACYGKGTERTLLGS